MKNIFTETAEESLLQRIGGSLKSVVTGITIFCISTVVLWKNEGCAVSQQAALDELKTKVVKADAQNPTPAFNGKPVLLQAPLYSKNFVHDDLFVVKQPFIKMQRVVEMFQWIERREKSSKRSGSRKEKVTYVKEWSEEYRPSAQFKESVGHTNPIPAFSSEVFVAKDVTFGKFKGENILKEVQAEEPIQLSNQTLSPQLEILKTSLKKNSVQVADNMIYLTTVGHLRPEIGDLRIKYLGVKSDYYSAIGTQVAANSLEAFTATEGQPIMIVEKGVKNSVALLNAEQKRNAQLTWIIRGVGLFLMWLGLMALLRPFIVLFDTIPFLGQMMNIGLFAAAAVISFCLASIIIVVAKLFYNPIYLVPIAALLGGYFYLQAKKQRSAASSESYESTHPALAPVTRTGPVAPRKAIPVPSSFKKSA